MEAALRNRVEMFGEEAGEYIFRLESKIAELESAPMTNPNPVAPKTDTPATQDALDRLAFELYGRKAKPREFIGGSDATILRDAATTLAAERASRVRGPEFYAYTPGAISDERLEGMIDETRWWKVLGDEVYEVVRELRALRASQSETEVALREIAEEDSDCGCDHSTPDCCVLVGVFCPRCIAGKALNKPSHVSPEEREK